MFPGPRYYMAKFENNQFGIDALKWEMKCLQTGATYSAYVTLYEATDTSPAYISGSHYGPHRIKCTATYSSTELNPVRPDPTFVELDINIVKPDKTTITQGLNAPFNRSNTKKALVFQILYGDVPFPYVIGWPQEKIWILSPYTQVIDWTPATQNGLDPNSYSISGNLIGDYKTFNILDADWNGFGELDIMLKYNQQNRLVFTDCTGTTDYIELTIHTIWYIKVNDTQLKMEEH